MAESGEDKMDKNGETVIIAMDGSEYSDYALQFYMKSVHRPDNHVIIAHSTEYSNITFPTVGMMSGDTMVSMITQEMNEEEQRTDELVDKIIQKMQILKLNGTIERIHGTPGPAIIALAKDVHADYIVVGCRGKGTIRRTVTGSVTDYIIHHSHVPVVVARHRDHVKHYHGIHLHNPFHKKSAAESHGHQSS
ncbi:universal stress protein Slr1101-like isoform X2 [Ruditapes philippinarum]|nr:universal stress protein Slr1101-like isoform X2 [Ruditapes philippinarum]XP_060584727.1 universal stress protein Slr1101-like isoform X2 [Ruditapes philippinarum]